VNTGTDLEIKWHSYSNLSTSFGSRLRHIHRAQVWVVSCVLYCWAVMALDFLLLSLGFNSFLLLRDEKNSKCVCVGGGGVCGNKMHTFTANIPTFHSRYRIYVLITNKFHEFCWSTISGTSDDGKVPYGPKSMHIFIMSKISHSHRKFDTRKWRGTKHGLNRAKVWPAGHITLVGRPCVSAFPKTILSTCLAEVVLKVSNAQRLCKEETWPPSQVAWVAGLTNGPHVPNLRLEHCLTPPINTMVLPPVESVKKVRFSPPKGLPNSIFVE
jgi:hypothetical protein